MQELKRVSVIPLKGTSDQDVSNYKRAKHTLVNRARTIQTFLKREALQGMVISLNQPDSKLNLPARPKTAMDRYRSQPTIKRKVSQYLQQKVRHSPKQTLKCVELWSDSHYNNVMKQCNLTKGYFLDHHKQIPEKKPLVEIVSSSTLNGLMNPLHVIDSKKTKGLKKKTRADMKSLLLTMAKRKERHQIQKKQQNLYKELSVMLKKKIVDYRVNIEDIPIEEFQNLRRCQDYCHLVEKNLMPQYKLRVNNLTQNQTQAVQTKALTTRASTARSSRMQQCTDQSMGARKRIVQRTTMRENLQRLLDRADDFSSQLRKCSLREELNAFEAYNQKLGTMMQSRAKSLARLR